MAETYAGILLFPLASEKQLYPVKKFKAPGGRSMGHARLSPPTAPVSLVWPLGTVSLTRQRSKGRNPSTRKGLGKKTHKNKGEEGERQSGGC